MDGRGYSAKIVTANKEANPDSLGVLLGRYCISNEISVSDAAGFFKVSKMTMYKWFTGKTRPREKQSEQIAEVLERVGYKS
jgi:hypothetical protein